MRTLSKTVYYALNILVFTSLLCCMSMGFSASVTPERSPKQRIGDILNMVSANAIDRVEVCYINWSADTYATLSADDLLGHPDCKVTIFEPKWKTENLLSALRAFPFRKCDGWPHDPGDYRLACVFYPRDGKEGIRILFRAANPLVCIDGIPYWTTVELLDAVAHLLPYDAYEEMRRAVFLLWVYSERKQ